MAPLHAQFSSSAVSALLLVSLPATSQANRHKHIISANSHCNLNCLNEGYCSFTKYTDYPQKGDVGYYQSCACRPGFGGGSCEKLVEECQPPNYKCHNGAPCEMDDNGALGCDCSHAFAKSELAGYMCRNPAMQACDTLDDDNKSFCTNAGVCLSSATASSNHLMFSEPTVHEGCRCNDAFYGEHCEFIKGMPESSLMKSTSSGRSAGTKAGISISLFAIAGILTVIFVIRRKRKQLRVRLEQSCEMNEDRFRKFYLEKAAKESTVGNNDYRDNDADFEEEEDKLGEFKEEEDDLQSMLESIDDEEEFVNFQAGTESEFV
ncbi:hypothetical protein ACHAXR_013406 [Thalassiosira sp. AJA248-18]